MSICTVDREKLHHSKMRQVNKYPGTMRRLIDSNTIFTEKLLFTIMENMGLAGPVIDEDKFVFIKKDSCCLTDDFAHALPTRAALDLLEPYLSGKVTLSLGSGTCLWEFLLQSRGHHVVPTDICKWPYTYTEPRALPPNYICAETYLGIKADVLFLGWPIPDIIPHCSHLKYKRSGYDDRQLVRFKGNTLVTTLDPNKKGRVGSVMFHHHLNKYWRMVEDLPLPSCPKRQYTPHLYVYQRSVKLEVIDE